MACCNAREKTQAPFFLRGCNEGEGDNPPNIQLKDLSDEDLQNYIDKIQEVYNG